MKPATRKIHDPADSPPLAQWVAAFPRPLVFTNGCFDILHRGHVDYLEQARALGETLLVAVNGDESVRRLKGAGRPVNSLDDRLAVLAGLAAVDAVVSFDADTPLELITLLKPDHLVKGGDWAAADIVGADEVRAWGGQVHSMTFRFRRSTSSLLARIATTTRNND